MDLYELKLRMWLRYIGDAFVIWPHGEEEINGFLQHLNGLQESKFAMELDIDNRIPFLDVLVHKQSDDTLRTTDTRNRHTQDNTSISTLITHTTLNWKSWDVGIIGCERYTEKMLSKAKAMRTTRNDSTERQPNVCSATIPYVKRLSEVIISEQPSTLHTRTGLS
ncbi:hypothetical protein Trydic_g18793 [Trypoxylus dichotomus]